MRSRGGDRLRSLCRCFGAIIIVLLIYSEASLLAHAGETEQQPATLSIWLSRLPRILALIAGLIYGIPAGVAKIRNPGALGRRISPKQVVALNMTLAAIILASEIIEILVFGPVLGPLSGLAPCTPIFWILVALGLIIIAVVALSGENISIAFGPATVTHDPSTASGGTPNIAGKASVNIVITTSTDKSSHQPMATPAVTKIEYRRFGAGVPTWIDITNQITNTPDQLTLTPGPGTGQATLSGTITGNFTVGVSELRVEVQATCGKGDSMGMTFSTLVN